MEVARNNFQRSEKLHKDGVISTSEYETALNNFKAAESALAAGEATLRSAENSLSSAKENIRVAEFGINSANARLKELRTSLQKTIITAPVSGIISKLNVEQGERVVGTLQMAGTEMMRIANLHSMEVQVDVNENDILKVNLNDEANIEVDAYLGRKLKGKVTEIANSADNIGAAGANLNSDQVSNFVVKIRIEPSSYKDLLTDGRRYPFRPGMSASVYIFTATTDNSLTVPIVSVTAKEEEKEYKSSKNDEKTAESRDEDEIKEVVFVVVGDTVAVREVKTGIQDNNHIEVLSGLQEGEKVVTGPYSTIAKKLKSGSRITITDKKKFSGKDDKNVKVEVD